MPEVNLWQAIKTGRVRNRDAEVTKRKRLETVGSEFEIRALGGKSLAASGRNF